jgi:putative membrane protein
MRHQFDAEAARSIGDAVRELENRSAAELVVEIRSRSGSYAHADARFAAFFAFVSLVVLVFMPFTVPPIAVLLDPIAVYALGLGIAKRSDALRRLFTARRERIAAARTQAAALFHERGVANTSGETGVLLFVSLLERRIEVLADSGLLQKVDAGHWNAALAELHVERQLDPEAVIAAIHRLGRILERDVPVGAVNEDELSNLPEVSLS